MIGCALELQALAVCVGKTSGQITEPLTCGVPTCHAPMANTTTNKTQFVCSEDAEDKFRCIQSSLINNGTTRVDSYLTCSPIGEESAADFDVFASNDCQCEAKLTSTAQINEEDASNPSSHTCACSLCQSTDAELVSFGCIGAAVAAVEEFFGECPSRTCSGECSSTPVENNEAIATNTTNATTTTSGNPTTQPPTLDPNTPSSPATDPPKTLAPGFNTAETPSSPTPTIMDNNNNSTNSTNTTLAPSSVTLDDDEFNNNMPSSAPTIAASTWVERDNVVVYGGALVVTVALLAVLVVSKFCS